jgi:hypothetical protein
MASCGKDNGIDPDGKEDVSATFYLLNEGGSGANNASLSVFDAKSGALTNDVFATVNGKSLGDVGNDIIVAGDMVVMAINGSNIIQFCSLDGKALKQTESVPNVRKLVYDKPTGALYATSYASDGYVAKIDLNSGKVESTVAVGYEPEGLAVYGGKLFVANSGGYSYMGGHGYEETISVIDLASMKETKKVKTGMLNLYGAFLQNEKHPRYILVNAAGDYMSNPAGSMIFDCETESVVAKFDFPATYAAQYDGVFYTIGSTFNFSTYETTYSCNRIDISSGVPAVSEGLAPDGGSATDGIVTAVKSMTAPFGIFISAEGEVFVSDAGSYNTRGTLSRFSREGKLIATYVTGVCPGHFAAL